LKLIRLLINAWHEFLILVLAAKVVLDYFKRFPIDFFIVVTLYEFDLVQTWRMKREREKKNQNQHKQNSFQSLKFKVTSMLPQNEIKLSQGKTGLHEGSQGIGA